MGFFINPRISALALILLTASSCSLNSAKKRYVLAEKLWGDGKYAAAVNEFEKVYAIDPKGKLGLQALFRAATSEALFLGQYDDALGKLRTYAEVSDDKQMVDEAQKQIGEILFSKKENYADSIEQYQKLWRAEPKAQRAPLYLFRIGKSQFFLWQFNEAIQTYKELIKTYPGTSWAEDAEYETGVTFFTRGEQGAESRTESYQDAIDAFESFLKRHPKSPHSVDARFGIASCLEEMDQLDAAYQAFEALESTYPSPNVIRVKLVRIKERKAQRSPLKGAQKS